MDSRLLLNKPSPSIKLAFTITYLDSFLILSKKIQTLFKSKQHTHFTGIVGYSFGLLYIITQVAGCRLQVAGSKWQVASGKWQVAGGRWLVVASGRFRIASGGKWQVAGGRWQVAGG